MKVIIGLFAASNAERHTEWKDFISNIAVMDADAGFKEVAAAGYIEGQMRKMCEEVSERIVKTYEESYHRNYSFYVNKLGLNPKGETSAEGLPLDSLNESLRNYEVRLSREISGLFREYGGGQISAEALRTQLISAINRSEESLNSLFQNEARYYGELSAVESMKDADVARYIFIAVMDDKTTETCGELNGEIFAVGGAESGVNVPPLHPNCRSVIIAYDEADYEGHKEGTSYDEWLKGYGKEYYGVDYTPGGKACEAALEIKARGIYVSAWGMVRGKTNGNGNYNDFKDSIGFKESSDNYQAVNQFGYLGRYQFGLAALQDIGFKDKGKNWTKAAKEYGISSDQEFLNNPVAQDVAFDLLVKKQLSYIRHYKLDEYIGQKMNGIIISESGLVAASHLIGIGGLKKAIEATDLTSVRDGNNVTAKKYMELFGGYNLSAIK